MTDILRLATEADSDALASLIRRSAHELQAADYPPEVLNVAVGTAFGLDPMLIADGTYFLIERDGEAIACGGWSFRAKTYGGADHLADATARMQPGIDAARIRAFFVSPDHARQGLGGRLLDACEDAARGAGFTHAEMVATLAGERLYSRRGWVIDRSYTETLPGGVQLPVIRMTKRLDRTGDE
ncbi:GNAT family N-acetyltransferase [Sandaracinobacteroides hominis]|uniref:GNAT family N-acetyltransferase n=1 Tax=Sandaracinobacteroides hominis TaxID=2780086 RepID=UPI0018F5CBEA|nr:GNAT family N-acetyltransferase [Sandaracinobacteroides hominis]